MRRRSKTAALVSEINPERVSDQVERRRALDHSQSFIVQAPAGSGKTELLIQRFLKLLGRSSRPESVVAITFTRKAAAEMRHRVIAALQSASGPEPASAHEMYTWNLAQDALACNAKFDWRLMEHPSRLRIQTIDSLSAMLVGQMPWISRMGAPPRPEGDASHLYRQAARRTLAMLDSPQTGKDVSGALSRVLAHLDNKTGTLERLLTLMLGRRDQWLRHVVGNPGAVGMRSGFESALEAVIEHDLDEVVNTFPENFREVTVSLAKFAAENLPPERRSSPLAACAGLSSFPGSAVHCLAHWLGIAEMFLTAGGTARRRLTKNEGFPATDSGRAAKQQLLAIPLDPTVVSKMHGLRSLPAPRFVDAQWDVLGALLVLLPLAVAQLRLVFQEEGRVDFTEVALGARTALGSDQEPSDLAFALDCRIQHLLVDEFQDTSQSQYELLRRLTGDWQSGDGRTLFLVGDPMQSIYGFREADVGLFLRAREEGVGAIGLTPLTLSVNFRSSQGIVDWVNDAFGEAFPDAENSLTGAVSYEPSVAYRTPALDDVVHVHPFLGIDATREAEHVLEIIRDRRRSSPGETIAVLVRARTHLVNIVSVLRRAGEKFRAVEIDALGERPVVGDLLALTRALLHPGDRIAWLSLLRAPWCGLALADLEALVNGDFEGAIWDCIQRHATRERMSADGNARLERVIPVLSDAIGRRGTLPVRRWVEGVWLALGGPACIENRTELEDAAAYLDLLEQSQYGLDVRDERKFAEDVARLFAPPDVEAGDGLQLLTIHKAKGLEFDTVILPGLGRSTRPADRKLLMWLEYLDRGHPQLLLAPIHKVGGEPDPIYEYLRRVYNEKDNHESTRLLYVAVTRARRHLHLLGHANVGQSPVAFKSPDARALLAKIWGTVEPEFSRALDTEGSPEPGGGAVSQRLSVGIPLRRLRAEWVAPEPPSDFSWNVVDPHRESVGAEVHQPVFEWATELQRHVGIVVHRMLQEIEVPHRPELHAETIRLALESAGLDGAKLNEAARRVTRALRNAVRDPRGKWILSTHDNDAREFPLSAVVEGRVRRFILDRTFVDGSTRWIIDYKTGTHEGGGRDDFLDSEQARYRLHLENYARAMQHLDSRPIRLGLYFPMLQGWREWAFDTAAS